MSDSQFALASLAEPLRGFAVVGRHKSIMGAANDLCLTQPALGCRVQEFEERLGTKLFVRCRTRSKAPLLSNAFDPA
jgi:DNA-binding transcriptional LysR family regulator